MKEKADGKTRFASDRSGGGKSGKHLREHGHLAVSRLREHDHVDAACAQCSCKNDEAGLRCSCCEDEEEDRGGAAKKILVSALLFAAALAAEHSAAAKGLLLLPAGETVYAVVCAALYLAAYLVCGKSVLKASLEHIRKGKIFDEQFLMSLASIGAVFVGEYAEAVAVMLFYNVGEFFQDYAVDKSKDSISALTNIRPDFAVALRGGTRQRVSPESVAVGELIEVKSGERVALDGIVESGRSFVDTSALTGESVPKEAGIGDEVMAGFINTNGVLTIRVTKTYGESAVSRVLELTQNAAAVKAKSERFITRFAAIYTPAVCAAAACTAFLPPIFLRLFKPELFAEYGFAVWIYRALTFLVVSCPCALVISVPLTFFSGIGVASAKGILVKGGTYMERLAKVKTAVFDKTGTLTKGVFAVKRVKPSPFAPKSALTQAEADSIQREELLALAAHAEYYSDHPISKSLKAAHHCSLCDDLKIEQTQEAAGQGIAVTFGKSSHAESEKLAGKTVLVGNEKLMQSNKVTDFDSAVCASGSEDEGATIVHVALEGQYKGFIVICDELKDDAPLALNRLRKLNVEKIVMLTGDSKNAAKSVADQLKISEYRADLLPQDKVSQIERLIDEQSKSSRGKVMFTGDGINDSPVLARSDVGVAMGALGSDAAIESADVVIMDDKLIRLSEAIRVAKKTMLIVNENIWLSLSVKFAIMICGMLGYAGIWIAVFGDVGVCLIAVFNALRLLNFR